MRALQKGIIFGVLGVIMSSITLLNAKEEASLYHHFQDSSLVRQTLVFSIPGGPVLVPIDKQGVSSLISEILAEGPTGMTKQEFLDQLFIYTAGISFGASERHFQIVVETLPDHIEPVLLLLKKILDQPKFQVSVFNDNHQRLVENRKLMNNNMRAVTFYAAPRLAFNYHASVLDGTGSLKTITPLKLKDVKEYYPKY